MVALAALTTWFRVSARLTTAYATAYAAASINLADEYISAIRGALVIGPKEKGCKSYDAFGEKN
jgi:hypothetical protein